MRVLGLVLSSEETGRKLGWWHETTIPVRRRGYDDPVVLHVASQGGPHVALVALMVAAVGLAGFFAVSGSSAGQSVLGLSRDSALAVASGLLAGLIFVALLII